ncbi:MAG: acyltransferase [Saprospiraceae bacterium]|nr:acyltransferase [Saprospiraceae bacterium]
MSKSIDKIVQLDALRAIAVFMVIFFHFLPGHYIELGSFAFGIYGVEIFFAISGFLITLILLEQKGKSNLRLLTYKNFIIKRVLRLFPIQYLLLFFFSFLSYHGHILWLEGEWIYYYSYCTNILFYTDGWRSIQLNHLWSLAVEEQFYLFWPLVILFLPAKKEWIAMVVLIFIALYSKIFIVHENLRVATFYHFDTLCGGGLMAYLIKYKDGLKTVIKNKSNVILIFIVTCLLLLAVLTNQSIFYPILVSIVAISLVLLCYSDISGIVGHILNNHFLQYFGKISYGLYLYHKFIPFYFGRILEKLNLSLSSGSMLVISLCITIVLAMLSYHFIEIRFLKHKEKFDF